MELKFLYRTVRVTAMKLLCKVLCSVFVSLSKLRRLLSGCYIKEAGEGNAMGGHCNPVSAYPFLVPKLPQSMLSCVLGN